MTILLCHRLGGAGELHVHYGGQHVVEFIYNFLNVIGIQP